MGAMLSSMVPAAVVGETGVLYDIDKLIYLGTPYTGHPHIFLSRKDAGANSLEKLRSLPGLRVGAQSVGHTIYYTGRMFAYLIGLKDPRFVIGYSGRNSTSLSSAARSMSDRTTRMVLSVKV